MKAIRGLGNNYVDQLINQSHVYFSEDRGTEANERSKA